MSCDNSLPEERKVKITVIHQCGIKECRLAWNCPEYRTVPIFKWLWILEIYRNMVHDKSRITHLIAGTVVRSISEERRLCSVDGALLTRLVVREDGASGTPGHAFQGTVCLGDTGYGQCGRFGGTEAWSEFIYLYLVLANILSVEYQLSWIANYNVFIRWLCVFPFVELDTVSFSILGMTSNRSVVSCVWRQTHLLVSRAVVSNFFHT